MLGVSVVCVRFLLVVYFFHVYSAVVPQLISDFDIFHFVSRALPGARVPHAPGTHRLNRVWEFTADTLDTLVQRSSEANLNLLFPEEWVADFVQHFAASEEDPHPEVLEMLDPRMPADAPDLSGEEARQAAAGVPDYLRSVFLAGSKLEMPTIVTSRELPKSQLRGSTDGLVAGATAEAQRLCPWLFCAQGPDGGDRMLAGDRAYLPGRSEFGDVTHMMGVCNFESGYHATYGIRTVFLYERSSGRILHYMSINCLDVCEEFLERVDASPVFHHRNALKHVFADYPTVAACQRDSFVSEWVRDLSNHLVRGLGCPVQFAGFAHPAAGERFEDLLAPGETGPPVPSVGRADNWGCAPVPAARQDQMGSPNAQYFTRALSGAIQGAQATSSPFQQTGRGRGAVGASSGKPDYGQFGRGRGSPVSGYVDYAAMGRGRGLR